MTNEEVAALVGNLAPSRVAHPTDPNNQWSGRASMIPFDGSDPQPGDQFEFRTSHGTYLFNVQPDGSWALAGEPKASTATKTPQQIEDDAAAAAKGRLSVTQPNTDAATMAQARAAQAKINAGRMPTSTELAALERVSASQNGGVLSWLGQQLQKGNGTQGFGQGSQWNNHEQGQDVNVPFGTSVPLVRGTVIGVEDWGYGDYAVVIRQQDGTEVTVGHIQKPSFVVGQQVSEADTVQSGGNQSPISSGPQVEIRVKQNGAYVDPAGVASSVGSGIGGLGITLPSTNKQHVTVGNTEYTFDPASGTFTPGPTSTAVKPVKPDTVERNGTTYQFDQTTDTWRPASGLPGDISQMGKVQQALTQHATTVDYIKSQLASGAITLDEANNYATANDAYLQAGLQGATPLDLQKQRDVFAAQQATLGKDLIDNQVTQGRTLADSLLTQARDIAGMGGNQNWNGFDPFSMADTYLGQHGMGSDMTDYAQGLVRGLGQPGGIGPGQTPRAPSAFATDMGVGAQPVLPLPPGGDSDSARLAAQAGVAA